jgi:hypothetical protein
VERAAWASETKQINLRETTKEKQKVNKMSPNDSAVSEVREANLPNGALRTVSAP